MFLTDDSTHSNAVVRLVFADLATRQFQHPWSSCFPFDERLRYCAAAKSVEDVVDIKPAISKEDMPHK